MRLHLPPPHFMRGIFCTISMFANPLGFAAAVSLRLIKRFLTVRIRSPAQTHLEKPGRGITSIIPHLVPGEKSDPEFDVDLPLVFSFAMWYTVNRKANGREKYPFARRYDAAKVKKQGI